MSVRSREASQAEITQKSNIAFAKLIAEKLGMKQDDGGLIWLSVSWPGLRAWVSVEDGDMCFSQEGASREVANGAWPVSMDLRIPLERDDIGIDYIWNVVDLFHKFGLMFLK